MGSRTRTTAEGRTALRSGQGVLASKALRQQDEFLKEAQKPSFSRGPQRWLIQCSGPAPAPQAWIGSNAL